MSSVMQQPYLDTTCPKCNYGQMREMADGNEWNLECSDCNAILFCYTPLPHQVSFHKDHAKYILYAGGY